MTTIQNATKEERKSNSNMNLLSKRASWNGKRKYNYKYVTSVF